MVSIINNRKSTYCIATEAEPSAKFAAEELQRYIAQISGCQIPIRISSIDDENCIYIGCTQWIKDTIISDLDTNMLKYDGFMIRNLGRHLVLTSNMGRGVVYAVYALLELLGCRWFYPGEYGEYIPAMENISFPELDLLENPDFELRSFTEDTHKKPADIWKVEMVETIDWCGKNKINSFHVFEDPAKEIEGLQSVVDELKKRGMRYEFGGHGAHMLIDRKMFEQKPYLFREQDGKRREDGNFCSSNEEAINIVIDRVKTIIVNNPEVDLLHLHFADVMGGSWCDCNLCKDILPSMQQMNVVNKVAKEIGKQNPEIKFDMALYHDTFDSSNIVCDPERNLFGLFAGRERCYAHGIGDERCERNRYYYRMLKEAVKKFKDNTYVFDYYADYILFREMKINIPKVINEDLKEYRSLGISKIEALMFGRYSWWAYEFNMHVYSKSSWCADFDSVQGLNHFCEKLYPTTSKEMISFYNDLEAASLHMLYFCGYQGDIQERDIPLDQLDFYQNHMNGFQQSIRIFERCISLLKGLESRCEGIEKERVSRNLSIVEFTLKEAKSVYHQMLGMFLHKTEEGSGKEKRVSQFDTAIRFLNDNKKEMESIPYDIKGIAGDEVYQSLNSNMIDGLNKIIEFR